MFQLLQGENTDDMQKWFSHIINHLICLGKTFDLDELNIKILKSLNKTWQPKLTTILKSQNITNTSMAALREHKVELGRLNKEEE